MSISFNAPDMVCNYCFASVDTVHDGDEHVAVLAGWVKDNLARPFPRPRVALDKLAELDRVQALFDASGRGSIERAHDDVHLCPKCVTKLVIDAESEFPFIDASAFHAPEAHSD